MGYTKIQARMIEEFGAGRLKADMSSVAWLPDDSVMVVIPRELFRLDVDQWGNRIDSLPVLLNLPFDGELIHPSDTKCSYTPQGSRKATFLLPSSSPMISGSCLSLRPSTLRSSERT